MGHTLDATLSLPNPDDIIAGRYRVARVIGSGAMGVVVEARHEKLGQRVAIKFLRSDLLDRPEMIERFDREAKAVARLRGEHVASVLDVGQDDRGVPYFVMEYLHGESVAALIARKAELSIELASSLVIEACAGLAEAHALGIVHRDVKPENLFLAVLPDGSRKIKILDFGVSKVALTGTALKDVDVKKTDTMLGSPIYMSPEQVRAGDVSAQTDFWSLGVTMFEMLAGRPPFHSESLVQLCAMILEHPIPDVRQHRPEVPAEIAELIKRCMSRDPVNRPLTAGDIAMALVPFATAKAAIVADTAVAISRRNHLAESQPDETLVDRQTNSALEMHLAARALGSSTSKGTQPGVRTSTSGQTTGVGEPQKSRTPLLLGVVIALLAVVAFLLFRLGAPKDTAPAAAPPPSSTASPTPAPPAPASTGTSDDAGTKAAPSADVSAAPSAAAPGPKTYGRPAVGGPLPKPDSKAPPAGNTRPDLDIKLSR